MPFKTTNDEDDIDHLTTPPRLVGYIDSTVNVVTRENYRDNDELTASTYSSSDRPCVPPRNLALAFEHEPLSATYHVRMVRTPKSFIPFCQQHHYRKHDYTTFYNGLFTHIPALVYNNIEELTSDLTPSENKKWRCGIVSLHERNDAYNGMVARVLGNTPKLSLIPLKCGSMDEEYTEEVLPFFEGECFRGEHLAEITIERYKHHQNDDELDIHHHALYYKTALEDAYNRINMELSGEPIPPDYVCCGTARTTGFVMPELGSQNKTLSMPGGGVGGCPPPDTLPCVRLYSYSAISGLSTTAPVVSKADELKQDPVKMEEQIKRYKHSLACADKLIDDNERAIRGDTAQEELLLRGILIRKGVLQSAESLGIDKRVRSRFKQRVIKGILKSRAKSFKKLMDSNGGCKIIQKSCSDKGSNDRTCLLDAVMAILPPYANSAGVEKSIRLLMPKEGDTSIAVASGALAAHGLGIVNLTSQFVGISGSPAFHILQVRDCLYLLNVKLTNLEGHSTMHFLAYDGTVLHDQDVDCVVEEPDRKTSKRSKKVFRELYSRNNGFSKWQILQVWSLVPQPLPVLSEGPLLCDEQSLSEEALLCKNMNGLSL